MILEISLIDIFDIFSISTAFMLGLMYITFKSKNNKANVFLGVFLWSLAIEVLFSFLAGQELKVPLFLSGILTLFLLFLYVIATLNYRFKTIYLLSLLPIIAEIIGILPVIISNIFGVIILVYILIILHRHQEKLGSFFSEIDNKTLSWVKTINYIYLFFYLLWIVEEVVGLKYETAIQYFALVSTVLTLVMIYWIGFKGFLQPEIFNFTILPAKKLGLYRDEIEEPEENLNKKIRLDNHLSRYSAETFHQLTNQIKSKRLYLQKDITIRDLSRMLKVNEKEFSKLINVYTKKNFYHYINQFRVEEFKNLIKTDKVNHLSLLGLSEEAGFSSKSTFYSAFKVSEGITPKQYLDQVK